VKGKADAKQGCRLTLFVQMKAFRTTELKMTDIVGSFSTLTQKLTQFFTVLENILNDIEYLASQSEDLKCFASRRDLQLVHRGFDTADFERRESAAR
jgi:hypothetical protein